MRFARTILVAAIAVGVLAGCTAVPAPVPTPPAAVIPATQTCEQVSDVGTLVFNLGALRREDRMTDQEWTGVEQLAARMLDRIEAEPGTAVAGTLDGLTGLIRTPVGGLATIDVEAEEWFDAFHAFDLACQDEGYPFGVYGWVGG